MSCEQTCKRCLAMLSNGNGEYKTVHECVKAHFQQGKGTHIRLLRVLSNIAKYRQHVWTWAARPRGTGDCGQWGHQCTFNCRLSRLCVIALILELIISQLCSSQEIREINGRRAKTCLTFRINGSCHQLSLSPQNGLSAQAFMKSIYTYDMI